MHADRTAIEAIPLSSSGTEASRRGGGSTGIGEDSSNNACGRAAQTALEIGLLYYGEPRQRRGGASNDREATRMFTQVIVAVLHICVVNGGN